jgi:predicted RNA-binding protein YlxR (DUF448 family)
MGTEKRAKHVPERSCIACRRKRAKWELIRIVRTADGDVEMDHRGKKAGRGAYLCKLQECWQTGLKKKRVEHALRSQMTAQRLSELLAFGDTLPRCAEAGESVR